MQRFFSAFGARRLGIVAALCIQLAVGMYVYAVFSSFAEQDVRNGILSDRLGRIADLRGDLVDMETGQRGYLLTASRKYLEPYDTARGRVKIDLDALRGLLGASEAELLEKLVAVKTKEMQETLALFDSGDRDGAFKMVRSDLGKRSMDEIRAVVERVQARDRDEVAAIRGRQERARGRVRLALLAGFVVSAGLLLGAFGLLEREVRQRRTVAVELAARNREMENFTYSVSHDLKAPLRGIDGYSQLLLEDYGEKFDEDGRSFLRNIRHGTLQMHRLIDDLLEYSRLERRPFEYGTVDPRALFETLLAECGAAAEDVDLSLDVRCGPVRADAKGLGMALRNLVDNAVKFTRDVNPRQVEIGGERTDAGACRLWVRDNGVGFDMKFHDRIFDIFQRLQRAEDYPGTGIGLAIVRKTMERMGGRAWAESEPGKGATFYLEFPG
ncbi:integral membrane sensor signal transduction histidine kinase [Desulfovibrio sp. X2]|uniref:sensor histidine kinase n=1 Tax=Desulfovibrio sp. X2 TaxID=941449 RepID=UPI0003587F30|nr:sensor histidine kinase [Desulfovibrio sp. X2]EPR44517.1 integral membrane sensor signal transduction histidine kinase [Desulfovibrio sp. X2]